MRALPAIAIGLSTLLFAAPAWAHHDPSVEYDQIKTIELIGRIAKVEWVNPHMWISIDVTGADGSTTSWMLECGPPSVMIREGLSKDALKLGAELTARIHPAKDGSHRADTRTITFNGQTHTMGTFSKDGSIILYSPQFQNVAPALDKDGKIIVIRPDPAAPKAK